MSDRMGSVEVDVLDMTRNLEMTVDVRVKNLWRLRIGFTLLWLATKALGCKVLVVQTADA